MFVEPTATIPTTLNVQVNAGTLDLNGNSQAIASLTSTNTSPFAGGTAASPGALLTNTSAATVNLLGRTRAPPLTPTAG